jgi:hypothetical protein
MSCPRYPDLLSRSARDGWQVTWGHPCCFERVKRNAGAPDENRAFFRTTVDVCREVPLLTAGAVHDYFMMLTVHLSRRASIRCKTCCVRTSAQPEFRAGLAHPAQDRVHGGDEVPRAAHGAVRHGAGGAGPSACFGSCHASITSAVATSAVAGKGGCLKTSDAENDWMQASNCVVD